jgi:hypothetical protein
VPNNFLTTAAVRLQEFLPIHLGQIPGDVLSFRRLRRQSEQLNHRLVVVNDPPVLINDQNTIFDRIKKCLEKRSLPRQALNDRLQTVRIKTSDSAENLVEKAGFRGRHLKQVGDSEEGDSKASAFS